MHIRRPDSTPAAPPGSAAHDVSTADGVAPGARVDPFPDGVDAPRRVTASLPPRIAAVKQRIIDLTSANTLRTDNVKELRAELDPLVDELEAWFVSNRPRDEVAQTRGAWKSLWYDDANIDRDSGVFRLDRGQIYQVVRDGYYYNVSDNPVVLFGKRVGTTHSFLKGNYDIADPAGPDTRGQPRRNVIALEFDDNRLRFGEIPRGQDLVRMVDAVDRGDGFTLPIPGPKGVTGNLWNAYQDGDPGVTDLYVLRRVRAAED